MSRDEDLRSLERDAAHGGATARLRYASALERAGRRGDAPAVLLPARDDLEVRRALARLPGWTHPEGDAGCSGWADVEPIRTAPRRRWTRGLGDAFVWGVLATPLAVVCGLQRSTVVLDPTSGDERVRLPRSEWAAIAGDVLVLVESRALSGIVLFSGERLWELDIPRSGRSVAIEGDALALATEESFSLHAFPDPRRPPREPLWTRARRSVGGYGRALLDRDHVVDWERRSHAGSGPITALGRTASSAARFTDEGMYPRALGGAVLFGGFERIARVDRAGKSVVSESFDRVLALTPRGPIVSPLRWAEHSVRGPIVLLAERPVALEESGHAVAVARDVALVRVEGALVAVSLEGLALWRIACGGRPWVSQHADVAHVDGRLYVLDHPTDLGCWEAP